MERRYRETESNVVREELAKYLSTHPCKGCEGPRLNGGAPCVHRKLLCRRSLPCRSEKQHFFQQLNMAGSKGRIAEKIGKEIKERLNFLVNVGLDYLSLSRSADTLSGGESQRIRLASQIGAGLVGVMYILDEPSIGLHQRDNDRLLKTLRFLRDLGNTVIVVEHDEDAIACADYVVDIGPGAGVHGGEIIAVGTAEQIAQNPASLTGQYLSGEKSIQIPKSRTPRDSKRLSAFKTRAEIT